MKVNKWQYRNLKMFEACSRQKRIDSDYYVEGYAATFERYLLFEDENGPVYEQFLPEAFDGCDLSDVIFQYDHEGKIFARTSNKTLVVEADNKGLFMCADLSRTEGAKELYNEISNGMVTKMSWGFLPWKWNFDKANRTVVHTRIKKVFDVSAVSLPANDITEIYARTLTDNFSNGFFRDVATREKILLKLKLEGIL